MSHVAESYVYRYEDGSGYVGRHPEGNATLVAKRGAVLEDEQVEALGLKDLKDRTDYDEIIKTAKKAGAPISVKQKDGSVKMEVSK